MVGTSDYATQAEIIDQLVLGVEDRWAVIITYQSLQAMEPVTNDIDPYGLIYHRGALYAVGRGRDQNEIRQWKVNRIDEAEVTQVPFQRPDGFDLREHPTKSFGVFRGDGQGDVGVKVRFAPAVAGCVGESRWHPSQDFTPQPRPSKQRQTGDGSEPLLVAP